MRHLSAPLFLILSAGLLVLLVVLLVYMGSVLLSAVMFP
jgi:hypothetical protein